MNRTTAESYHERILRVLMHIQRNLDTELTLETLSRVACFSPFHFHRIFRALVGESLMAHIRRLRLERAALRLRTTTMPVIHVAFEAGYETHEAFTRAFRSMFGVAPSRFRREAGAIETDSPTGVHYAADGGAPSYRPPERETIQMDVRIEKREPCRVAFVRHVGPYAECAGAWQKLMAWAGPRGLLGPQMKCLGLSYDDPKITPPDKLRYDACLVITDDFGGEGEIGVQEVVGGDHAVVLHEGPYEKLFQTYAYVYGQWLPQSGYQCRDAPPLEIYLNNPQDTAPEDLRTQICIPVERG